MDASSEDAVEASKRAQEGKATGGVRKTLSSRVRATWHGMLQRGAVRSALGFVEKHKRFAPALFFLSGVLWDVLTLDRIDSWVDNSILLVYLTLLGVLLMASLMREQRIVLATRIERFRPWFPHAIQFLMGALFSAYVIFYSRSASLTGSSVFLVLLAVLLVANEFIHRPTANVYLLFSLYLFTTISYFTFFIPVLTGSIGYPTFLLACLLGLGVSGGMLTLLHRWKALAAATVIRAAGVAVLVALFMNLLYWQNWIPPVPLALSFGGVYHNVDRAGDVYVLRYEQPPWYRPWVRSDQPFKYERGDSVYCFVAVFAPTTFKQEIFHRWRYYDEDQRRWVTTDRIGYEVVGGRDGGYRGFTYKRTVRPGDWHVDVTTMDDRILGRVRFSVVARDEPVSEFVEYTYR